MVALEKKKSEELLKPILGVRLTRLPEGDFSLHVLTCKTDATSSLWAIMSFCYFSETLPRIFIHNDGTLTINQKAEFRRALPGVRIVDIEEGENLGRELLNDFPLVQRLHLNLPHPMMRKLTQPWLVDPKGYVVLLDSDVLHFRMPADVLNHVANGRAFFNSDYQDAHYVSIDELTEFVGQPVLKKFNAGYMGLHSDRHSFDLIEAFLERFENGSRIVHRIEQSVHACMLTKANATRLPEEYVLGRGKSEPTDIANHYVNDGSRPFFVSDGVAHLVALGFPERFSEVRSDTALRRT